ncbi:MAG: dTMP kinase [bacterium]
MKTVVIIGIDGSGKTTQANLLKKALVARGKRAEVVWLRGESYLTKPLLAVAKRIFKAPKQNKRGEKQDEKIYQDYTRSKSKIFGNPLARQLWKSLSLLDTWITFRMAKSRLRGKPDVIIFDRYVYDTVIDIASAFGAGEREIIKILRSPFLKLFPKPDLLFLIDLEAEEAMRRKNDIPSISYLLERRPGYRLIAETNSADIVDGSKAIDEIASEIVSKTLERVF